MFRVLVYVVVLLTGTVLAPTPSLAHCDGLDGPVVKAAQWALETGNVNAVLIWVPKRDEDEIRRAFKETLAVRALGSQARVLADLYFFGTVVRIHRAGEGAPYTGLKPAGRNLGPAIPAADQALADRSVEPLLKLVGAKVQEGIREHFEQASAKANFTTEDVDAGREYVEAYVAFIHYVEGIYEATQTAAHGLHQESKAAGGPPIAAQPELDSASGPGSAR